MQHLMSRKMGLTINIRVSSNSLIWKCNWIVLVGGKCINHKTIGYEIVLNLVSYGIKKYYLSSRWRHVRIPLLEGTASSFMIMSISLKHCNGECLEFRYSTFYSVQSSFVLIYSQEYGDGFTNRRPLFWFLCFYFDSPLFTL